MIRRREMLALLAPAALAGCASGREHAESLAHVGAPPPAAPAVTMAELRRRAVLELPGIALRIGLSNRRRGDDDGALELLALPASVDPRALYAQAEDPQRTRVFVHATPREAGFVFVPARAVLVIGEKRLTAIGGFVFGQWDASGRRIEEGGRWDHRRVEPDLALADVGRSVLLAIDFAATAPPPGSRNVTLDLAAALRAPRQPPLPLIRFAPARWREGYF